MGIDLVRDMFANATKWKLNTVRLYAHTTDPDHPFMVRPHSLPSSLVHRISWKVGQYKWPSSWLSVTRLRSVGDTVDFWGA